MTKSKIYTYFLIESEHDLACPQIDGARQIKALSMKLSPDDNTMKRQIIASTFIKSFDMTMREVLRGKL